MKFRLLPEEVTSAALHRYERCLVILSVASYAVVGPILVLTGKVSLEILILSAFVLSVYAYCRRGILFSRQTPKVENGKGANDRSVAITFVFFLLAIMGLFIFLPIGFIVSSRSTIAMSKEKLSADLSISNQVAYLASGFSGEPVVVYRILNTDFPVDKFIPVRSEGQRLDLMKKVSEIAAICNADLSPSKDEDFYVFYGNDYFVVCTKSKTSSYLIFLGAQR